MESFEHQDYFRRRAQEERAAADHAVDERAARPHRELAERYEECAQGRALAADSEDESMSGTLPPDLIILP